MGGWSTCNTAVTDTCTHAQEGGVVIIVIMSGGRDASCTSKMHFVISLVCSYNSLKYCSVFLWPGESVLALGEIY